MWTDRLYNLLPTQVRNTIFKGVVKVLKPRMLSFFANFVSPGDLVFDVGTNVGDLTQIFLDLGGRVICIEPQPSCIEILKKRFKGNTKVFIVEKGLADREGILTFYVSSKNHATSTFSLKFKNESRYKHRVWDETKKVAVTTLDKIIEEFGIPKFCKIDVEGFEPQVIGGLHRKIPALSFEFTKELLDDTKKCLNHLALIGQPKFNYSLAMRYCLSNNRWMTAEQIIKDLNLKNNKYLSGDIFVRF